jgi:hypothetical protein
LHRFVAQKRFGIVFVAMAVSFCIIMVCDVQKNSSFAANSLFEVLKPVGDACYIDDRTRTRRC